MMVILNEQTQKSIQKNIRINVMLNEYLYQQGKIKAFDLGINFSNYVRNLISQDLERGKNGNS